jgi:hypothetical protein
MKEHFGSLMLDHAFESEAAGHPQHGHAPPNACPPGFAKHAFEYAFRIDAARAAVWSWLDDPETFVRGQIWPFRVEFLSTEPSVPPGFSNGGLNVHHGPLMCFAGQLTEIREGAYRCLHYFYGSYVLSLRLIRPTALEFWVDDAPDGGTHVRLRVSSFVHRRFARGWSRIQALFWRRFPRWMSSALGARLIE